MKRAAVSLFLLAFSTTVFAATAGTTYPVIVGLKKTGPLSAKSLAVNFDPTEPERGYKQFSIVNAFAANLTLEEIDQLRKSSSVAYVEEDAERHAFQLEVKPAAAIPFAQVTPYGIDLVRTKQAWVGGKGANINVVIADTGIDKNHPDLAGLYQGGLNTFDAAAEPIDDNGHGTHCAGIVAAQDNTAGVVGVAPKVKLWAVKVLNAEGSGSSTRVIQALEFAAQKKTQLGGNWIVSLSLGSCRATQTERTAFETAINAGLLVIAAAGNHDPQLPDICGGNDSNSYAVTFPAAYTGVVAVAAIDSASKVATFSNFGPEVAVAAPGVDVLSSVPQGTGDPFGSLSAGGAAPFRTVPMSGSPSTDVSGPYVFCNLGKPSEFPSSVKGKIALIKRGELFFHDKAVNAKAAGAIGVVVFNNTDGILRGNLINNPGDELISYLPTVGISQAEGQALIDHPQATLSLGLSAQQDDYAFESGTSMACPHVVGAAAAVWSMAPGATAAAVKQALIDTAHDIDAAGVDNNTGKGLIDVEAAGKLLAPAAFSNPSEQPPAKPTGRVPGRRGH